jgi:hypothetical protein
MNHCETICAGGPFYMVANAKSHDRSRAVLLLEL